MDPPCQRSIISESRPSLSRRNAKAVPALLGQREGADNICKKVHAWKSPSPPVESDGYLDVDGIRSEDQKDDFVVIGREDKRREVISRLLAADDALNITGIYGMDGIGKTTLAQKVYGDSSVHRHFDCFAWASVGKDFRTRRILLQHVCRARDDMASFPDLDLAQKLYEFLQSKRFLIALDDVWSADAWECPPRCIFVSRTNRQQSAAHRSPLGTTELRRRFLLHQPRTFSVPFFLLSFLQPSLSRSSFSFWFFFQFQPSAFFFTVVPPPSLSNSQPPFFFF